METEPEAEKPARFEKGEHAVISLARSYDGRLAVRVEVSPWQFYGDERDFRRVVHGSTRDAVREVAVAVAAELPLARCECGHKHWRVVGRTLRPSRVSAFFQLRFRGQPFDAGAMKRAMKLIDALQKHLSERGARVTVERLA